MAKGIMIDVVAPHGDDEEMEGEEPSAEATPSKDGDAIIASIEAQLAKLRSLMSGIC